LGTFFVAHGLLAHPGVGIVRTKGGVVYFTDLSHVWSLSPRGEKTIAVRNVHTHELYLDENGDLFGEHLWYEGDATKKWGYRVWRLGADGTLSDVVTAREGFRTDFSFVRDASGTHYFSEVEKRDTLFRKSPGRPAEVMARGFTDIRWITAAPNGTVYLVDRRDVVKVTPDGRRRRIAADLSKKRWFRDERHLVMGIWLDAEENVYVAVPGDGAVKRISKDGRVATVVTSRFPWAPSGGLVTPSGDLYVLEYSKTNAVRVRRVAKDAVETIY